MVEKAKQRHKDAVRDFLSVLKENVFSMDVQQRLFAAAKEMEMMKYGIAIAEQAQRDSDYCDKSMQVFRGVVAMVSEKPNE